MFDFKRAVNSALATHPEDELTPLFTKWGESLDPAHVLQDYPRPQMRRKSYENLNGWWDYAIVDGLGSGEDVLDPPRSFDGRILVPFSPEALLSGVERQLRPGEMLWYRRYAELPAGHGMRTLLHFEAVDFECDCFVNGRYVGRHEGGYLPFTFDVTDALDQESNEGKAQAQILLAVTDPSNAGVQPRGKQRLDRGSIWYTAQSGIWQTVWAEMVPSAYIESLAVEADPDDQEVKVSLYVIGDGCPKKAKVILMRDGWGIGLEEVQVAGNEASLSIAVNAPRLWSPEDPYLYGLHIIYGDDSLDSYCAFRTCTVEKDACGVPRFCLNHKPYFLRGLLDQGYWPDGLMTAPSDDALIYDIELAQSLGFNMLRKHIKVECARWYYHCDRMGMLVWQDMVNAGGDYPLLHTSQLPTVLPVVAAYVDDTKKQARFGIEGQRAKKLWLQEAEGVIRHLRNHPSIVTWVVFNEGWGQFDASKMTDCLKRIDPTRPFDQASGWFDQGGGDFVSEHNYFRDLKVPSDRKHPHGGNRAAVISEFGGLGHHVKGHSSLERAYGYALHETPKSFRTGLKKLLREADALRAQGLSGYVYTQLSDVEEEVNGLVTYDRKVRKA